ncbi:hypothetical protein COEREDRAFT_6831 [Coemansia reversa NRRL 1564]|uniref:Uncharacterized protein n=1 Tax=Coemansia reversa (strain ATCC 12441 / NRRL 1564) TaxID=763665 RepID=A0A2G5BGF9_COERN|nr:hypothetical protein COEREDRAFT_6831 [Coemansia reversa NRRL 1564]|eukprot:PIA18095.1 hypothetical protein COEREDRAFT_6831 [Coemansia reversa NRRL 1564]
MYDSDVLLASDTGFKNRQLQWCRDNPIWTDIHGSQDNTAAYIDTPSDTSQSDREYSNTNRRYQQTPQVRLNRSKTMYCDIRHTGTSNGRLENRNDGSLSDIKENSALRVSQTGCPYRKEWTTSEGQRRYLNQSITTAISDGPNWSQLASVPSSNAKTVDRQPWKSLGRRLSLGFASNRPRNRQHIQAQDTANSTNASLIMVHPDGLWESKPKQQSSWLDTIRMRLKGRHRHQPRNAKAIPIASQFDSDFNEPIEELEETDAAIVGTSAPVPTPCYPRLRSQPSLCRSQSGTMDGLSPSHARDEAVFVPDVDNIPLGHSLASTPQRQSYISQQPPKAQFMLPRRLSVASSTQYSSLD